MNIHFIIHEAYEGPGAFLSWIKDRNYLVSSTRVYLGESLPSDNAFIDVLIVLGGPQCPETTTQECHYFEADKEVSFIRDCIKNGCAVVGVCLGAQLIGEALGAKFEKSPNKEIGYFPIEITVQGRENPKLKHFSNTELVAHWHNDMPGLTSTSKVLAKSIGCPRQIVEYSNITYGFQCHLEFTSQSVTELIDNSHGEFEDIDSHKYVQKPHDIITRSSSHMNSLLYDFMDSLIFCYKQGLTLCDK